MRFISIAIILLAGGLQTQDAPPSTDRASKPEGYSPIGFFAQRAYEQAFPETPGNPVALRMSTQKYWAFQGVAYRGGTATSLGTWTSLGPETVTSTGTLASESVSGRVAALAISPTCERNGACRLWVGTAGGGVWRTEDALNTTDVGWRWVSKGLGTNSIGSLTVDPSDRTGATIYVGTGETNQPNNSGAGTGLYRSTDAGDNWVRVSTMIVDPTISPVAIDFTFTRGISSVVIDPGNPQTLYVATTTGMFGMTGVRGGQSQITGYPQPRVGLYRTENRGASWTLLWVPPFTAVVPPDPNRGAGVGDSMIGVRHVKLDPKDARIVYASAFDNAIHRSASPLEGGDASFRPVFGIVNGLRLRDLAMFDLTVKDGRTRMYAYNGTDNLNEQALYRLDNADVPAASLVTQGAGGLLTNTASWVRLSSNDTNSPASTSRRICTSQCFYDLVVAVPEGKPDTVYVGGVATPTFGEPTIRSTDAGQTFRTFGSDAQNPRFRSHVDVRAVAFHPRDPDIVFVGSDGGVVRSDGRFSNISDRCSVLYGTAAHCATMLGEVPLRLYFMNKGLQTMQFYNVSVDPANPLGRLIGGLQDNGTIWTDGNGDPRVWKAFFPNGDGTSASGFHPTKPAVAFASFQSNFFFVNFRNADQARWVRIADPIRAAAERETILSSTGRQFLTFDRVRPDTQFTGFQHIWRTQNNGGDQAFLEANCLFSGGTSALVCGDWLPLGVSYPFATGSTAASASRQPGDLTSGVYGDRAGGLIVSAERSPADVGTLWAATNLGRLFIAKNADGPAAAVSLIRIDTPAMPNRFVTRIFPDRSNPNVAFISYSGFNAITPSTPGHIFRAVYDPDAQRATFTSVDFDLGDIPINTIAFDHLRADLYAATDYGPLVLKQGSTRWEIAGVGFPEALMVDFEIVPEQRILVAATHGLGIFYMKMPPVGASPAPASRPLVSR